MACVLLALFAIASWISGGNDLIWRVDEGCQNNPAGCGVAAEALGTLSVIAVAYVIFTSWRMRQVVRPHLEEAVDEPWKLVPTASPVERVVGRTGLCEIIERDLADRTRSRPQVIVAGVGDGKTAAIVRLTKFLFDRGAVPVPIALRDAAETLDFVELAKERFKSRVGPSFLSEDESDRVWRELCHERLVVILADGLEEALPGKSEHYRAEAIRLALQKVDALELPIVIASRPDGVLDKIDVALIRLEPLAAHRAIDYIRQAGDDASTVVERWASQADVMERPLYLKLARELHKRGQLASEGDPDERVKARYRLLKAWEDVLLEEQHNGAVRMEPKDRENAIALAKDTAVVGLVENKLEVKLGELPPSPYVTGSRDPAEDRVLAGHAAGLDLVEAAEETVRFRHSIMQAYLGAWRVRGLLAANVDELKANVQPPSDDEPAPYLQAALGRPGRELLMALVMACLCDEDAERAALLRDELVTAARPERGRIGFELLAAAYELHVLAGVSGCDGLGPKTRTMWEAETARDERVETVEAKLRTILPIAEAGGEGRSDGPRDPRAWEALWHICCAEYSYTVRFQAAQRLAAGGDPALAVVASAIKRASGEGSERFAYGLGRAVEADADEVRIASLLGWIMPLLAVTCGSESAESVRQAIAAWVKCAGREGGGLPGMHLGVQAALAQGFKWEANRKLGGGESEGRDFLIAQARELLVGSTWWHTRVATLQALALWALDRSDGHRMRGWIKPYCKDPHPFVRAAAEQCMRALGGERRAGKVVADHARRALMVDSGPPTVQGPSRHIWIDEVGVAAKIGPQDLPPDDTTRLWIPPAAGWHALEPRARQLVGDILVFLNLIERTPKPVGPDDAEKRTGRTTERERRRLVAFRQGPVLPACLVRSDMRDRLLRTRSDGEARCCPFDLCPYPSDEYIRFRGDVPETFCREQQQLLAGRGRKMPHWENDPPFPGVPGRGVVFTQLRQFWYELEKRDRG